MEQFSRSKSNSQVGGGMSPRPPSGASVPRSGPAQNILKSVESHVRLMSHLENIATSSSYTALRLRNPGTSSSSSQAVDKGSSGGSWSDPYTVSRVHRGSTTEQFYAEVVAPCVSNSTSGQSYVFLVNGPAESGRSQTLYGSPHHGEVGLVELAAADYVQRMEQSKKLMAESGADARPKTESAPREESPAALGGLGGLTVTYSAFIVRGSQMVETASGEAVRVEEFPAPLGTVALPFMQLLTSAPRAVVIPEKKHVDTSCVIQFQVYAPVDAYGRRAMATVTFVDVAAFRLPLCKDVQHLVETVQRVAGISSSGGDPQFQELKLTTLLEPALVGYVTLVSITTISGRPDLYADACAALQFSSDIHRIHQVLMLIHIQSPKWLFETGHALEQLRLQREALLAEHYERGVHDYYLRAASFIAQNASGVDGDIQRLLTETEEVRQALAKEVNDQCRELQAKIDAEDASCRCEADAARSAHAEISRDFDVVKRLDEDIAHLEQQIAHQEIDNEHRISEMRLEISSLESRAAHHAQEVQRTEKEMRLYYQKAEEVGRVVNAYADDLRYSEFSSSCRRELRQIAQKRARLESELEMAAQVAHRQTDTLRVDRERRSRLTRLTLQQGRQARSNSMSTAPRAGSKTAH